MRLFPRSAVPLLVAALTACSADSADSPLAPTGQDLAAVSGGVRLSELHYDNSGTDVGEAIEITGPAGTDLAGWSLVLYNGSNGAVYNTRELSDVIPASCGSEGAVAATYPSNGIQNGSPDAIALVDAGGNVVWFLSYEGTLTAVGGPADGQTSQDIGATQTGSSPAGQSLQRNSLGGWAIAPQTFGTCNDVEEVPVSPTTVVVTELMGAPLGAESASWGEWFEVHNYGAEPVNLAGFELRSGGQAAHTISAAVIIEPGAYAVLGRGDNEARNGHVTLAYNYFTGGTTIWLDDTDWLVLRSPAGATVDSVAWSSLADGATRGVRDVATENADVDGPNWGYGTTPYGSGDFGTPGEPNTALSDVAPPVPTGVVRLVFTGRDGGDPALPVGFEDQLFVETLDANGDEVTTAITWSAASPEASVDQDGVVRALAAGTALIRATTGDGRIGVYRVPTRVAVASSTALYEGHTEFGVPADADPGDDLIVTRAGIVASWSIARSTPNWVSYDLEATHFGAEDRCDCFTADPAVPAAGLTTADYTGAGAYHDYPIDRGHLVRSADRTAGSLDNAHTYYFTNIIPQAADMNQGPWSDLEIVLGDRARSGAEEVYIVAGVAGSKGTVKDEGLITIPASVWKVAVVMPRDGGLDDVLAPADLEIVAVDMPNVAGIRNEEWTNYRTTIDAIEAASGYDLLHLLPDHVEWLVEAGFATPADASADELVEVLDGAIEALVGSGALPAGTGAALRSKLTEAAAYLAAGQVDDAAGAVRALRNQLRALDRAGQLPAAQYAPLDAFAAWIAAAIG